MAHKGFAVIDFETTGFSPQHHHRVIEVGLVHVSPDGVIEREFETVINPGRDLGPTRVHQLRGADVRDAPTFDGIAVELIERLRGRVLVAHNARFETAFLRAELSRLGITSPVRDGDALCTMKLARTHLPGAGTKLADCCAALGIPLDDAHEALADARATALLLGEYRRMGRHDAVWWQGHSALAAEAVWPRPRRSSQAQWMPRRRLSPRSLAAEQASTHQPTTGAADMPLAEQALDWLRPRARKRFGELPVAVVERVARQLIAVHTSRPKMHATDDSQVEMVADQLWRTATSGRAPRGAPHHPRLARGDVVVLTGVMSEPRDRLEQRLTSAGFVVEPTVTKRTALLVAADPDSLSGKARKARAYDIPIVGEHAVAALTRTK
jgi:DNA polymerase-3 subunit epsilon